VAGEGLGAVGGEPPAASLFQGREAQPGLGIEGLTPGGEEVSLLKDKEADFRRSIVNFSPGITTTEGTVTRTPRSGAFGRV